MKARLFAALAVSAVLAAGCGPATNYKYRIAVIPKGLSHEFWQSIHRGADRAAADLGGQGVPVEILWDGPQKESDSLEQINIIKTKTSMGINGLVLAPQDSVQMVKPVQQVVEKNIPVVIIDSGLDKDALEKNPDLIVKYVATDNYNGGRLAAKRLLEVMDKAGIQDQKIVLFRYAPGSESTEQREKGFHDFIDEAIKNHKPGEPNITWQSDNQYAGATVADAQKTAGPLLGDLRNVDGVGIFAVNESAAAGMLNSIKTNDLRKKFKFVGFDSSEQLLAGVKEGDIDGLIVQDPYRMGYLAVTTLVKHLEGYDVSKGGKDLGTGEYVLTAENLDADETRQRFVPELQAKRTTEQLLAGTPTYDKKP
jgi:ribose transport system substrate-binding protein